MKKLNSKDSQPQVVLVTGPTGSGKTDFINSILGEFNNVEVVNMDSIQTFDHFKIGSGRADVQLPNTHLYGYQHPMNGKPVDKHIALASEKVQEFVAKGANTLFEGGSLTYLPYLMAGFQLNMIGIYSDDLDWVFKKMQKRTEWFIENGLIEEVQSALELGYAKSYVLTEERVVYLPVLDYLDSKISLEQLKETIRDNMYKMHLRQLHFLQSIKNIQWYSNSEKNKLRVKDQVRSIFCINATAALNV